MIVATFNVRGRLKKNKIKELLRNHKVDFLAIQETKMEDINASLCANLWGNDDFDWAYLPSEGNNGGILSIWKKSLAKLFYTFTGEGLVGVYLEWGVLKRKCIVINVYSKCDLAAKKRLWEKLVLARNNLGSGAWCILGDFHSVGDGAERRGVHLDASSTNNLEITLFNAFKREVDSEEWNRWWGDSALWVLPRDVSDHCPLVLKVGGWDWGPRPFRFNNFWLENPKFKPLVEEV